MSTSSMRGLSGCRRGAFLCGACAGLLGMAAAADDPRWDMPSAVPVAHLPRLTQALTLDGDLSEWGEAAAVPLRFASYIAHRVPAHTWNGPADSGMELFCGWNPEGLCLAGFVSDDDVRNNASDENSFQQDCLELFVDGRAGDKFMKPPYTPGSYQFFVRPPLDGKPARLAANPAFVQADGMRISGKPVPGGWTFELLLPWSLFPGFTPKAGAAMGLQFGLDDYDSRDGVQIQPQMITWRAAAGLSNSPQKLVKWTLVDTMPEGGDTPLDLVGALDGPTQISEGDSAIFTMELGQTISACAKSAEFQVRDWNGATVATGDVKLKAGQAPWNQSSTGTLEWAMGEAPDGVYTVEVVLKDASGAVLGNSKRFAALYRHLKAEAGQAVADAVRRLREADIPKLAATNPFQTLNWLGTAACAEKLKWAAASARPGVNKLPLVRGCAAELQARIAVASGQPLPADTAPRYRFLQLAARPEAQVVVEYPLGGGELTGNLSVTFMWGSFPLAGVSIQEFATEADAMAALEKPTPVSSVKSGGEKSTIGGFPAMVSRTQCRFDSFDPAKFDPAREVMVCSLTRKAVIILGVEDLAWAAPKTVLYLDGAPADIRKAAEAWQAKENAVAMPFAQASAQEWFLVVGAPRAADKELAALVKNPRWCGKATPRADGVVVHLAKGAFLYTVSTASLPAAERVLALVTAGNPVSPEEVDALRAEIAASIPKPTDEPPPSTAAATPMRIFCGDVHAHSIYSDGSLTSVGMALQAFYNGMDFFVLSDHNSLDGALVAAELFRRNGLKFNLIVGEEITTNWIHMNAYPLRELIDPNLSEYETIKAAHLQGAVIQWNHPGAFDTEFFKRHAESAASDTGLDAWEHRPAHYAEWKREGRLPLLTGSTDTHSGTFDYLERTVIFATSAAGDDVAEAVRRHAALQLDAQTPDYLRGGDAMISRARAALDNGKELKESAALNLKTALREADLPKLLLESPATAVKPAALAKELEERAHASEGIAGGAPLDP